MIILLQSNKKIVIVHRLKIFVYSLFTTIVFIVYGSINIVIFGGLTLIVITIYSLIRDEIILRSRYILRINNREVTLHKNNLANTPEKIKNILIDKENWIITTFYDIKFVEISMDRKIFVQYIGQKAIDKIRRGMQKEKFILETKRCNLLFIDTNIE